MNDIWKNILVAALSAIISFAGSYYLYSKQLEISKLDLHKSFEGSYFSKPKFPSDNIVLTVNGEERNKLGLFQISLVNYTVKDYVDIPINIRVTPKNKSDFKVLAYSAVGQNEVYDLVEELKGMEFDGGSYNFSYKVSTINRTDESDYGMQLRILFEGAEEPEVNVVAKGVGVRDFDIGNSPNQKDISIKAVFLGMAIVLVIALFSFVLSVLILGPVISVLTRKIDIKSRKKYAGELFDSIKNNGLQPNKTDEEIANFVADMLYQRQCAWWDKKTPIGKWSLGLIAPVRSDHLVEVCHS
ncbi:hypothetical protein [Aeromonas bivalvium]|uniref:hypothetical protein n=1 Tax=Aeromonas bivalvium TaxID=440079 RepID=UPI0038CFF6B1